MDRFAIIENDEVVNVIVADQVFIKEQKINAILCDSEVSVGWKYDGKKFIAPPIIYSKIIPETTDGIA